MDGDDASSVGVLFLAMADCMMERDTSAQRVSRGEFGVAWPLTVPDGLLSCEMDREITFQWKGTQYTLTPTMRHSPYADIEPIHATTHPGDGKTDLGPLVARARELCG